MAATLPIPLTTLPLGETDAGPVSAADGLTTGQITIDRTVAGGFNSQPAATQLQMTIYQSQDGGATWLQLAATTVIGGVFVRRGVTLTESDVGVSLIPGTGRQVKAAMVVSGSPVAVQGSLTVQ